MNPEYFIKKVVEVYYLLFGSEICTYTYNAGYILPHSMCKCLLGN